MTALLEVAGVSQEASAACAPSRMSASPCRRRRDFRDHRPERRRQDHAVQRDRRRVQARRAARSRSRGSVSMACRRDEVCRRGIGRTFQLVRPFPGLTVEENVVVGALLAPPDVRVGAATRARGALAARSVRQARSAGIVADAARPQAARSCARARHRTEAAAARRGDGGPAADRDRPHGRDPAASSTARPA